MRAPDATILKMNQAESGAYAQRRDASQTNWKLGHISTEMEPSDKDGNGKSTLEKTSIWQLMHPGVPLVVNFGSCS